MKNCFHHIMVFAVALVLALCLFACDASVDTDSEQKTSATVPSDQANTAASGDIDLNSLSTDFYYLKVAFDNGIISDQDLQDIAYAYYGEQIEHLKQENNETLDNLDETLKHLICLSYVDYLADRGIEMMVDDVYIRAVYYYYYNIYGVLMGDSRDNPIDHHSVHYDMFAESIELKYERANDEVLMYHALTNEEGNPVKGPMYQLTELEALRKITSDEGVYLDMQEHHNAWLEFYEYVPHEIEPLTDIESKEMRAAYAAFMNKAENKPNYMDADFTINNVYIYKYLGTYHGCRVAVFNDLKSQGHFGIVYDIEIGGHTVKKSDGSVFYVWKMGEC